MEQAKKKRTGLRKRMEWLAENDVQTFFFVERVSSKLESDRPIKFHRSSCRPRPRVRYISVSFSLLSM